MHFLLVDLVLFFSYISRPTILDPQEIPPQFPPQYLRDPQWMAVSQEQDLSQDARVVEENVNNKKTFQNGLK